MAEEKGRKLFVFDFDNTLVNDNTDTWVGGTLGSNALDIVKNEMSDWWNDWRQFVNKLLLQLHYEGASPLDIFNHMKKLRMYNDAMKAVQAVRAMSGADAIIISDANSVFIDCILEECGVKDVFINVFTNPASFNDDGLMSVTWYHTHSCLQCIKTPNMCKGTILREFLDGSNENYTRVIYVGDGKNDLCPLLQLGREDVAMARRGYGLDRALAKRSHEVKATVHIIDFLTELNSMITSQCV